MGHKGKQDFQYLQEWHEIPFKTANAKAVWCPIFIAACASSIVRTGKNHLEVFLVFVSYPLLA
jgi:hypothetical protein